MPLSLFTEWVCDNVNGFQCESVMEVCVKI